jgi:hypothetical protein
LYKPSTRTTLITVHYQGSRPKEHRKGELCNPYPANAADASGSNLHGGFAKESAQAIRA